ncbi:integral membrane protein [Colletotrichum higginsianum]|nr:integral membrane protein [Colletotrichum higginsianum]
MAFPVVDGVEVMMAPPENYHVNFTNPFKDTATINASYWAFGIEFAVALLFLAQRVYTASFILRKWRSDDCQFSPVERKFPNFHRG